MLIIFFREVSEYLFSNLKPTKLVGSKNKTSLYRVYFLKTFILGYDSDSLNQQIFVVDVFESEISFRVVGDVKIVALK